MLVKHHVKCFGSIMEGKSHVSYEAGLLFFLKPVEAVQVSKYPVMITSYIVEEIVIKKLNPAFFSLLVKYPVPVLLSLEVGSVKLGGKSELISVIPVSEHFFYGLLTLKLAVHICRIKIRKAVFYKCIDHFFGLFDIYAALVVGIRKRQPHEAKSKFFICGKYISHCHTSLKLMLILR